MREQGTLFVSRMEWAAAPHVIVFLSALAATVTGYGFVLLASPLLLVLLTPVEAVPLSIGLGWVVITTLLARPAVQRAVGWRHALRLAGAGLLGVPVGTTLLLSLDADVLRLMLGMAITTLALVSLSGAQRSAGAGQPQVGGTRMAGTTWPHLLGVGFSGGILSGSSGLGGAMLVLFLSRLGLDKHRLRATSAATIWCTSTVSLGLMATSGAVPGSVALTGLTLLPALAAGMVAGGRLFGALPDRRFRQVSLTMAAAAGAVTALTGARGLIGAV